MVAVKFNRSYGIMTSFVTSGCVTYWTISKFKWYTVKIPLFNFKVYEIDAIFSDLQQLLELPQKLVHWPYYRVSTSSGNHGKPGKSLKKSSMLGKIIEFEKTWIIMENHGILWNNLTKPPVARKLAARHLCVRQLVFWLLVLSSFNNFKMHACMVYKHAVVAAFCSYCC